MRVLPTRKGNVDRPEPAAPQRCDACTKAGNRVEVLDIDGVIVTVCASVLVCRWREVSAL